MAVTNGQRLALFLLLSSRSELRLALEGKSGIDSVTHAPISNDQTAAIDNANAAELVARMGALLKKLNIDSGDLPNLNVLFDLNATTATAHVTTDTNKIRRAFDLSGIYPDDNPCPSGLNQELVVQLLGAAIP
jgi:hypothetical protein